MKANENDGLSQTDQYLNWTMKSKQPTNRADSTANGGPDYIYRKPKVKTLPKKGNAELDGDKSDVIIDLLLTDKAREEKRYWDRIFAEMFKYKPDENYEASKAANEYMYGQRLVAYQT